MDKQSAAEAAIEIAKAAVEASGTRALDRPDMIVKLIDDVYAKALAIGDDPESKVG